MFISPMLLEKSDEPFDDQAFLFEPKIDGHRLIMSYEHGETRLFTRHNNECTRQYPELWNPAVSSDDFIIDGKVCSVDPDTGRFSKRMIRWMCPFVIVLAGRKSV